MGIAVKSELRAAKNLSATSLHKSRGVTVGYILFAKVISRHKKLVQS